MTPNKLLGLTKRMREALALALARGDDLPKLEAVFPQSEQRHIKRSFPASVLDVVEALGDALDELDEAKTEVDAQLELLDLLAAGHKAMEAVDAKGLAERVQAETEPDAGDAADGAGMASDTGLVADGGGEG